MRNTLIPAYSAIMMFTTNLAWGHGGAEELGHHWVLPVYTNEIHLQIALMAVIACAVIVCPIIARRFRNRGAGR